MDVHPSWFKGPLTSFEGLWADHVSAWNAFAAVCTQWRVAAGMSGFVYIGLDYAAVHTALEAEGIAVSPTLWRDLRDIEAGAIAGQNGNHS